MHQGNKTTHFRQEILMKCYIQGVPINMHQGNETACFRQDILIKCQLQGVPLNITTSWIEKDISSFKDIKRHPFKISILKCMVLKTILSIIA